MIGLLLMAQIAGGSAQIPPDLMELSRIVAPYAACEFKRDAEVKGVYADWLPAQQRQFKEPNNAQAKTEAATLTERLQALKTDIQKTCGYEEKHEQLRKRLLALHSNMDEAQAFWLARGVFNQLNNMNEQLIRLKAGIRPPAPPPPPAPPRAPPAQR